MLLLLLISITLVFVLYYRSKVGVGEGGAMVCGVRCCGGVWGRCYGKMMIYNNNILLYFIFLFYTIYNYGIILLLY